ncbi:MAG: primase C-terminal domain-containing protein [Spirochaetota bacterium]|nr:primase C-terminal domain-containing protein [Spirochaetota bacterium]
MTLSDLIFARGGYVLTAHPDGRPRFRDTEEHRICSRRRLAAEYRNGTRRFVFPPASAAMVGVDLDMKSGKDGIAAYRDITGVDPREGFHVVTPSGGVHLYFFTDGRDFISAEIRPGVEIKGRAFITLPGSRSDRGAYTPHGDVSEIVELPAALAAILPVRRTEPEPLPARPANAEVLPLARIFETVVNQGTAPLAGSRNQFIFSFARFARRKGHSREAVVRYLASFAAADFSVREIQNTVRSAWRGGSR